MSSCPLCGGIVDAEIGPCACGFNAREVHALQHELSIWRRYRSISLGVFGTGFAILLVVPAFSLGLAAGVGGVLVCAGTVLWAWSRLHMRMARRAIRSATTRTALPEARIV